MDEGRDVGRIVNPSTRADRGLQSVEGVLANQSAGLPSRRPAQAIIDRMAEAFIGYRGHGDAVEIGVVEFVQHGKEVARGLLKVAPFAEVQGDRGATWDTWSKGQKGLAGGDVGRVQS